jgi:thiol-disulfide isomerase/thioredoxin
MTENVAMPIEIRAPALRLSLRAIAILVAIAAVCCAWASEPAPEFTHARAEDWLNSAPLHLDDLRGRVVLIDIWTFGCWNCYRSFPWLKAVEERYRPQGLQIIGVHTPELDHERDRAALVAKVKTFGLHHPVMIDNDHSYWNALGNRFWPAFYLIDKRGRIRDAFVGEIHAGDPQARVIEMSIERLLAEPG